MKIAKFKSIEFGHHIFTDEGFEECDGYLRISEYIDVDFQPLENKEIIVKHVDALKDMKKKIQADTEVKLVEIDRKIGDLLALTHDI